MVTYLGSLVHLCCGEGRALQTNNTGVWGKCSQCLGHTGFSPAHGVCAFPVYTTQAPGCSAGELSKVGPALHAFPRSKPLRFMFSDTPQRHRLSWASFLCPSQVQTAQVTRCLANTLSPDGVVHLITSPIPAARFPWCTVRMPSQVCGVSSGELISGCDPPGGCQDARKTWLATGGLLTFWWRMLSLGPRLPLSLELWLLPPLPLPLPPVGCGLVCSQLVLLW